MKPNDLKPNDLSVSGNRPFFIPGGTLPGDAPSYVTRQADHNLLEGLRGGQFCYVLTSRQMGKSSLMVRTANRLRKEGVAVAVLDLTALGQNLSVEQWYFGLLEQLGRHLRLEDELDDYWQSHKSMGPMQRWMATIRDVVLSSRTQQIVVFVDEIDIVRSLPFSTDEFFAAIRECYNRRAQEPQYARLTFCLLGVATPNDLIKNTLMTPFNIGRRIELTDFAPEEAAPLSVGISVTERDGRALLNRVLYWTGGHPYLTQRLCSLVAADTAALREEDVDRLCADLFLAHKARESDDNLQFVRNRLLQSEVDLTALLDLYARVRQDARVADDETNPLTSILKLSGIVRVERGELKVRNRIYVRVFDRDWVRAHIPGAELRRQRIAYRQGLVRALALSSAVLVVFVGLAMYGFSQARRANHNADLARQSTTAAQAQADTAERISYIAHMNLLQREWETNNVAHVIDLLAETKTYKSKGFEWGYWNRLCHLDLVTMKGLDTVVTSVAFSPDDQWIMTTEYGAIDTLWNSVTGGHVVPEFGGIVRLWNAQTGEEMLKGQVLGDASGSFSPDSQRIVTGSKDGSVKVLDVRTGQKTLSFKGHAKDVTFTTFSPDGRRIVTGSDDKTTKVWDAQTGKMILPLKESSSFGSTITFSPDGHLIATNDGHGSAKVWDAQTGRKIVTLKVLGGEGTSVFFSPDGKHIVPVGWGETTKVRDAYTGQEIATLQGHSNRALSAAFSPDCQRIVMGTGVFGHSGEAIVWDARTGREIMTLKGHNDFVTSAAFLPNGQRIITGSRDGTAKIWDTQTGKELLTLKGHTTGITSVAFAHDGKRIVTGGDGEVKIWDVQFGRETLTLKGHSNTVWSAAFSPDGKHIVTGSRDGTAKVWDAETGQEALILKGHSEGVSSVAFSPDGQRIVTGSYDKTARVWDVQTGKVILTLKVHKDFVSSVAFSPDGQRIVAGCSYDFDPGEAKVWDAQTGRELLTLKGHTRGITSVTFSPDGRIVTGSHDGVKVWDARTGQETLTLKGYSSGVESVAFSTDGKRIVTGSKDRTVRVWDARTGDTVLVLKGHIMPVSSVAFSPDGQRIITAGGSETSFGDGEVKVWDTQTGQEILALKGYKDAVRSVAFSPDGKRIITASGNIVNVLFSDPNDWKVAMRDTMEENAHLSLAESLVAAKKYDEAIAEYKVALRLRPSLGSAPFWAVSAGTSIWQAGLTMPLKAVTAHWKRTPPSLT